MEVKYKVFKFKVSENSDLIFYECPDAVKVEEMTGGKGLMDLIGREILKEYPKDIDYVDIMPEWLNHDYARLFLTGINKLAAEEKSFQVIS